MAGIALPHATFTGDASKLLVTFLGLISASILPTISLIVGSMTASGRSVKAVNDLGAELSAAMDALFALFGLVGFTVALMVCLSAPLPAFLTSVRHLEARIQHVEQGFIIASVALLIFRSGQIPAILRKMLAIKRDIALDEARRKTNENAPTSEHIRQAFPRHERFGQVVSLTDLDNGDRR